MAGGGDCAQRVAWGFGVGSTLGASIGELTVDVRARAQGGNRLRPAACSSRPHTHTHTHILDPPTGALYGTYEAFKHKVRAR